MKTKFIKYNIGKQKGWEIQIGWFIFTYVQLGWKINIKVEIMDEINFEIGSIVQHKKKKEKVLILDKLVSNSFIGYVVRLQSYGQVDIREFELEEIN